MKISIPGLLTRSINKKTAFEVEEELKFHVEMLERKYTQQGMSNVHAKAAALKRFGNLERIKQQCVDISRRNTLLRRILKISSIFMAFTGLAIHASGSDYKVVRIGTMLITIALASRLLLYVRGLSPWTVFPRTKETSLSVVTEIPKEAR